MVQTHQVPHAQLFWGPEGSAKLPLALAFATYLHCQNRQKEDACGQCGPCIKMQKLIHPDVMFVFPTSPTKQFTGKDVVSTNFLKAWRAFLHEHPYGNVSDWNYYLGSENKQLNIPKEEARQITQYVSLKAFEAFYKVVLIWLPEYLHPTAANALLKVLEEPPPHTLFLLVNVHPDKVLSTIRSRTQQVHIPAFTDTALSSMLVQQCSLDQQRLAQIVLMADGNFNKALKLAVDTPATHFDQFKIWMRLCYTPSFAQLLAQAEAFQQMPKEDQKHFLAYCLHMMREALVIKFGQPDLTRTAAAEQEFSHKLRQTLTDQQIKDYTTWLNQAYYYIERNANPKILYLDLSLKIAHTFRL